MLGDSGWQKINLLVNTMGKQKYLNIKKAKQLIPSQWNHPDLQPAHFGRVYATYGGIFVVLPILWGWQIDGVAPDRFDQLGGLICLIGVCVIMYWPKVG